MGLLISFVSLLLYIAVVILIAFAIVWLIQGFMGWTIDANDDDLAPLHDGLLCVLTILVWLSGVLGMGGGLPLFWRLGYG